MSTRARFARPWRRDRRDTTDCRSCGGPLAPRRGDGAFVGCSFCGAQNLMGRETAKHRGEQLDRELAEYRELVAAAARCSLRVRTATAVAIAIRFGWSMVYGAIVRFVC